MHLAANLLYRQIGRHEQSFYFINHIIVNPFAGSMPANIFNDGRKMFRRYAKLVGIIAYRALLLETIFDLQNKLIKKGVTAATLRINGIVNTFGIAIEGLAKYALAQFINDQEIKVFFRASQFMLK